MNIFDSLNKSFLNQHLIMEDMLWKFPHVGQQIFKNLSNKNLVKSKEVARTWEDFITNEKFYKQKVHYETKQKEKNEEGWTPLHKAAEEGKDSKCKLIMDNVEDKNPKDDFGWTPLHLAAWEGHLSVCQLIVNNVEDKNPKKKNGYTPLHFAVFMGHFEIFKLIFENVEDKNPLVENRDTLLHVAAMKGHLEICKYIVSKVEDKNLAINVKNISNKTPIDMATRGGHQQVVDFLRSILEN